MNPHYHHPPYPDLSSPHSPNSDGGPSSYHGHRSAGGPPNGHIMGLHHEHSHQHQHPAYTPGGALNHHGNGPNSMSNYHHHHHYHHYLNNNSNSSNNNNNNNNNDSSSSSNNNNNGNMNNQNQVNAVCAGCNSKIMDRYLLKAMERHWHNGCLKCHICQSNLADIGTSCFIKDSMILCKQDYMRIFGSSGLCSGCRQTIPANEMVMRAGGPMLNSSSANTRLQSFVYHIDCFVCCKCNVRLVAGDKYCVMNNGTLVCEKDWHVFKGTGVPAGQQPTTGTTVRKGKVGRPRRSRD